MAIEVILPKVDMDMATGRISKWYAADGAAVKKGDVLFEIETDKAAMEIDAPASGILRDVTGGEGVNIAVGAIVGWIYAENEAYAGPAAVAGPLPEKAASPVSTVETTKTCAPAATGGDVRATPLARRAARDAGIAIGSVRGSGPNGRIVRGDVEAHLAAAAAMPDVVAQVPVDANPLIKPPVSGDGILKLFAEGSYALTPHSGMRRTIARRLVEAKSTVPHFYLTVDCDIDALSRLREELNASAPLIDGKSDYKLSVNDMVIKAYALALRAVPEANVSWTEDNLVRHRHADIGVAVSVPGGLITPIVRHAEVKTLSAISGEMRDLGARARDGKLRPEEYQGGTAAISNLGMFGVREFAAIVNPPHASILAVGAGEKRAVVRGDDIVVARQMTVTLSTDHRAVDGALAATLIGALRSYIERPMSMLV